MVYKYDEIIAVLQTEGEVLEEKKAELKTRRYENMFKYLH